MKPRIPFLATATGAPRQAWFAALQSALPEVEICELQQLTAVEKQQCQVAIVTNPPLSELAQLPNLIWVHSVWAGVETLMHTVGDSPLKIVRLIDPMLAETMAEAVLAWTLYLHRDMPLYRQQQQRQIWQSKPYRRPHSKTVGILGLGQLGQAAAAALLAANFKLCGWSQQRKSIPGVQCFAGDAELLPMLSDCDIVVCLLPLTSDTHGLLSTAQFNALPTGAQLINFGRGQIIDDDALRLALDQRKLQHAVLDVFATEPLPVDQWQWQHPNVTVLPHCAAPTDKTSASLIVAANIRHWLSTGVIEGNVNLVRGY
jgi:glyoxylate/hydroxypyruvate reductase